MSGSKSVGSKSVGSKSVERKTAKGKPVAEVKTPKDIGPKTRLLDILRVAGAAGDTIARFGASPHISMKEICAKWGEIPWDLHRLSNRRDLDPDLIHTYRWGWNWQQISTHVDEKTVTSYPDLPWHYGEMSSNMNISMTFVASCLEKPWERRFVSAYTIMSPEGMRALVKSGFINFAWASCNRTLTIDILLAYPDAEWDMYEVTRSRWITDADIARNPQIKWCDRGLCMRANIPERLLENIRDHVSLYSLMLDIRPIYLIKNPSIPRTEYSLSLNTRMTHGFIKLMPDVLWDAKRLVQNRGLRWKADQKQVLFNKREFAQRWTTSPYDVWKLSGCSLENFVRLMKPDDDIWQEFRDVSEVMGRRIVKHLKPYTWVTRRNRINRLVEAGFPPGVARLIVSLM